MHRTAIAMRHESEEDPKKPHPLSAFHKGDNQLETQEHGPRSVGPHGRKDDQRDFHRHVHRV